MKANRSIRAKLITLYVAILTLVFVCFGVYIYAGFKTYLIRSLQQTLTWRAQQIASAYLELIPLKGEAFVGNEIQTRYAPELNQRVIRITDSQGHQIYGSKNSDILAQTQPEPVPGDQSKNAPAPSQVMLPKGERLEVITVSRRIANGTLYQVEVGAPETDISRISLPDRAGHWRRVYPSGPGAATGRSYRKCGGSDHFGESAATPAGFKNGG
jgi:hypothetical protein